MAEPQLTKRFDKVESTVGVSKRAKTRFWSLDNPDPAHKTIVWKSFFIFNATARILLGAACVTLPLIMFSQTRGHQAGLIQPHRRQSLTVFTLSVTFGCSLGICSVLLGMRTIFKMASVSVFKWDDKNHYKHEMKSNRVLLLVGFILTGALLSPALIVRLKYCLSQATSVLLMSKSELICDSSFALSFYLFAVAFGTTIVPNLPVAVIGFRGFFGINVCVAFFRFFLGCLVMGCSFALLSFKYTYRGDDEFESMTYIVKKNIDTYYILAIGNSIGTALANIATAIWSLMSCWWRSRVLVSVDAVISFVFIWILCATSAASFYCSRLITFFCNIEDYYPTDSGPILKEICLESNLVSIMFSISWLTSLLMTVQMCICLSGLFCCKPKEWEIFDKIENRIKSVHHE